MNSSEFRTLRNWLTLVERPDTTILRVLGDELSTAIVLLLLAEDATQKELGEELGATSPGVSRRMSELEALGLVSRDRSHGPYMLAHSARVRTLLEAVADLAVCLTQTRADTAAAHARELRKAGLAGGRLRDRERT